MISGIAAAGQHQQLAGKSRTGDLQRTEREQRPLRVVDERGLLGKGLDEAGRPVGLAAAAAQRQQQPWWRQRPEPELVAIALGEWEWERAVGDTCTEPCYRFPIASDAITATP